MRLGKTFAQRRLRLGQSGRGPFVPRVTDGIVKPTADEIAMRGQFAEQRRMRRAAHNFAGHRKDQFLFGRPNGLNLPFTVTWNFTKSEPCRKVASNSLPLRLSMLALSNRR